MLKQELGKLTISKKHKHTSEKIRSDLKLLIQSCKTKDNDIMLVENCMITYQKLERLLLDFEEIQIPIEFKEIDPIKIYLADVKKGYRPIMDLPVVQKGRI